MSVSEKPPGRNDGGWDKGCREESGPLTVDRPSHVEGTCLPSRDFLLRLIGRDCRRVSGDPSQVWVWRGS